MNLVVAEDLHVRFGEKVLFSGAGFSIRQGDRIGLVGANGTGKSTLFKLLDRSMEPDDGRLIFARGTGIGHLPQEMVSLAGENPLGTVLSMVPGRQEAFDRIRRLEEELSRSADPAQQEELARELARLHEHSEQYRTTFSDFEAKRILTGLGFMERDFRRPLGEFSAGWVMRVMLAGLLFQRPDLLLLDEPTNHLDVPSVVWLDEFLSASDQSIVLISHDREFLNRQVARIFALEPEGLRIYRGNFDGYVRHREQLEQELEERAKTQQEQIERAKRFINRFRAKKDRAKAVQSKIKTLEKLERVQVLSHRKTVRFSFPDVERSGKEPLKLKGICKSFGDLTLYRDLEQTVLRGERVAVVGRNGAGKTTLLRIIAKELDPDAGDVVWGHNMTLGIYAQRHADALEPDKTVLDSVWDLAPSVTQTEVRKLLGSFLFSGDDVLKAVGVLSGGEKTRVALARLLIKPANLMLLDEPTNHLDLESSEMLAEALSDFKGTMIFVSHNRSFVNRLATRVWEIDSGTLTSFPGNLEDYLWHKRYSSQTEEDSKAEEPAEPREKAAKPETAYERRKRLAVKMRDVRDELRPLMRKAEELEQRISELENEQAELSEQLADPEIYKNDDRKSGELVKLFEDNRKKIEELTVRWEFQIEQAAPLQEKLEKLEKQAEG